MANLFFIPIEPIEERYSTQWLKWFKREFEKIRSCFDDVIYINPEPLVSEITEGQFLDVVGTNWYKAAQLKILLKYIQDGTVHNDDIIFFMDYWFPGVEMLAYAREGLHMDIKIVGCLHAGTWDQFDFLTQKNMTPWAEHAENCWFEIADMLFVATEFHKNLIVSKRKVKESKIKVTGFPIYEDEFTGGFRPFKETDKPRIVFPHRLAPEKQPSFFDYLQEKEKLSLDTTDNLSFIKTKILCRTKKEYYEALECSTIAISFALQETWGIAMQEAVLCGCIPIVPDRLSYSELFLDAFKYEDNLEQCKSEYARKEKDTSAVRSRIESILNNQEFYKKEWFKQKQLIQQKGEMAIPLMLQHILQDLT